MTSSAPQLRVGVVGYGKAGGSLTASLTAANAVVHVASRQAERRSRAQDTSRGEAVEDVHSLLDVMREDGATILFLAVPDDAIDVVAANIMTAPWIPPVVAHLSGARGREALDALSARTAQAAFHPLAALDGVSPVPPETLIAIDANDDVRLVLVEIATSLSARPATVQPGGHAAYHAGAVVAGNLPVALVADAVELLIGAGVDEETARLGLARLLESTARALQRGTLSEMLTGPIARADETTLVRHLAVVDKSEPGVADRYRDLSRRLLDIAPISAAERARLAAILEAKK